MKDTETKLAFVQARAEGKSYSTIKKELGIAKATCSSWEHELRAEIQALKNEKMEELYTTYSMGREARITALGEALETIETKIQEDVWSKVSTKDLLELKLKYIKALKEEYIEPVEIETDDTLEGLLEQYNQLYRDSKTGKYNPAEIKAQLAILDAKRDTLYRISGELTKEEESGVMDMADIFGKEYESKLLRREA